MKNKLISPEAIKLLHTRIEQEELSSRLYEQMSLWLNNAGYINSAKKWKEFALEEMEHSSLAKTYLLSFGILPELPDLDAPVTDFKDLPDIIQKTYDHEVMVSEQCLELTKKALEMNDFMLFSLGQKYNKIQVKEMEEVTTLTDIMKTFGTDKHTLLLFDSHINEYI